MHTHTLIKHLPKFAINGRSRGKHEGDTLRSFYRILHMYLTWDNENSAIILHQSKWHYFSGTVSSSFLAHAPLSEHVPLLKYRRAEVNCNTYDIGTPTFSIISQNAFFRL